MPDKELEFESQVDALIPKLKSCSASEASALTIELANIILSSQLPLSASSPENAADNAVERSTVSAKVHSLAVDLQPKVMGVDWNAAFLTSLEGQFTPNALRLILDLLWTVGGPRTVGAFFGMKPAQESTCKLLADALAQLGPNELGTQFHLPVIIEQLEPVSPLNYEPVAEFLGYATTKTELDTSPLVVALVLMHFAKHDMKCEIKPDALLTLDQPKLLATVFNRVARAPKLALTVFDKVKTSDAFVECIARSKSFSLLETWIRSEQKPYINAAIDVAIRADLVEPDPMWSQFLARELGSNPEGYEVLLDFLTKEREQAAANTTSTETTPSLGKKSLRTVAAIAMLLQTVETDRIEQVQTLQLQLLHNYPRLINFGQGHDETILQNSDLPTFAPDIEAEMKLCFEKMYEQQHDIQDVIPMLERLKQSAIPREQDLFACMIHSLFDEYRFFPQYPVKALATTAVLFGSLVHFRLIEGVPLAIALKFILDALHMDSESNMFRFGLQALVELRQRLPEMPKYCKMLLQIPGLEREPHFYEQIKSIADPETDVVQFRAISDIPFEETAGEAAPDGVIAPCSESVRLIINNLTVKNIAQKAEDLAKELSSHYPVQFAKLISNRAANEPNNHGLYAQLLQFLPPEVRTACIDAVISTVAFVLNGTDRLKAENRTLIKRLGQFLGMITLQQNRPLLFQQLNLKLLLAEGVRYEKLTAVLPFVAKVLAQIHGSKVFVPQNPWVAALLAVLSELYQFGSLSLTLKFEIEVLGHDIHVDIQKIEPAVYIRDEVKQQEDAAAIVASRGGPAALNSLHIIAAPQQAVQKGTELQSSVPPFPVAGTTSSAFGPTTTAAAAAAPTSIAAGAPVAPSIGLNVPIVGTTDFATHPGLRQLLDLARTKALQEVLLPVIDRSVTIASFTAKELILKDFVNEPDEGKLQAAAHAQALMLASSMAIVTARDPFIEALALNLRAFVAGQGYEGAQVLMDQIGVAARETMDSLVPLIESVARDKAIIEVDEALLRAYRVRQQARQLDQPYKPAYKPEEPPIKLPDGLAVRKDGVSDAQMGVYEQFAVPTQGNDAIGSYKVSSQGLQAELHKLTEEIQRLEILTKSSQKKLGEHKQEDEVLQLLSKLTAQIRNGSKLSEEVPLRVSHLVVHAMFDPESTNNTLYRESLCYLLGELCRMSGLTAKEVVLWLLYADDAKKYNANVIGTLLRARLVTPAEIDASLIKDLADAAAKPEVVDYAARLLLDALLGPEPYCLRSDFAGTIQALSRLNGKQYPAAEVLIQALQETRGHGSGNEGHIFAEWTRLIQHHSSANQSNQLHAFVRDLYDLSWSSNPEQLSNFIRAAVTVSVKSYVQSKSFVGMDAIAVLITTLLKIVKHNDKLARNLFATLLLLIAKDHESGAFESLPFFRVLSSIACTLPVPYLPMFVELLLALQPLSFPGFASSWMTVMSHRFVMGRLLSDREHWPLMFELVKGLLMFTKHVCISLVQDSGVPQFIVRAVERIFLVILHDAPEFFVRYADETSALIVSELVQLRNVVLCAFPEGVELPDLVSEDVEYLEVCKETMESVEEAKELLTERNILKLIENACVARGPQITPQVVSAIQTAFSYAKPVEDRGIDFDSVSVSMVDYNAFATYVAHLHTLHPAPSGKVEDSSACQLCGRMLLTLSRENRYAFASAIVNHLRYCEQHTAFFKGFILALFTTFGERMFKDGVVEARHVVTRVLLERLMAYRPHPWGLMFTFGDLLKTPKYNFREMPFIKGSPAVSALFSTLYAHISRTEVAA